MATTYANVLRLARALSKGDQVKLAQKLLSEATEIVPDERVSIMELEGLGKGIWEGIGTDAYIRSERDSWDR